MSCQHSPISPPVAASASHTSYNRTTKCMHAFSRTTNICQPLHMHTCTYDLRAIAIVHNSSESVTHYTQLLKAELHGRLAVMNISMRNHVRRWHSVIRQAGFLFYAFHRTIDSRHSPPIMVHEFPRTIGYHQPTHITHALSHTTGERSFWSLYPDCYTLRRSSWSPSMRCFPPRTRCLTAHYKRSRRC